MFENIKFWFTTLLVIGALGGLGYLAFSTIDSGSEYVSSERLRNLQKENDALKSELEELTQKLDQYEPKQEEVANIEESNEVALPAAYKHSKLISEFEELIKDNIQMKLKSHGTRVGTVQNFLNIYNNTNNKIDNDYGASTKTAVALFQKSVGLPQTGEAGKSTFEKMIEWLKKQG